MVALDQRHLRDRKTHRQRNHAEGLERDPEIRALGAPDDFVQDRHREEEQRPAHGEDPPAVRRQIEHLIEHDGDEGTAEQQAAAEDRGEQAIDDGGLDLDEGFIVQHQGQGAEHDDDDAGDQRHHRDMPRHHVRRDHRRHDRHHEGAGGDEQVELGVGDKEDNQRPELGRELEQRMWGGLVHYSIPAIAWAKSRAVNGARSSMPSPTPIKCTGSLCFSASATRMPPRAVPSSFVITRPVTPAVRWNASTCDSAFCPTVASSTSSTACGADASTFLITRTTFSSSFISSALFCKRPAVSTSSTSSLPSRAAVSALKARLAESEPCAPAMTGDLVRSPHIFNCSIAAARKVSPAASITLRPSALNLAASLPMVVVLPEPLTPTTRITNGFCTSSIARGFATGARTFSTSVATTVFTSSAVIALS